jgi:hypothetical protein
MRLLRTAPLCKLAFSLERLRRPKPPISCSSMSSHFPSALQWKVTSSPLSFLVVRLSQPSRRSEWVFFNYLVSQLSRFSIVLQCSRRSFPQRGHRACRFDNGRSSDRGPRNIFCFLLFYIAATILTMAFPATTMLEVLVFITWACLSVSVHKNGLFTQLFSRQTILFEICSAASLSFCWISSVQHFVDFISISSAIVSSY